MPGVREALRATAAPVVGVSGIIGGDHVRGMARQLLGIIGVEVSRGRRRRALRRPRRGGGVLDGWLVDTVDAACVARVEAAGIALPRRTR